MDDMLLFYFEDVKGSPLRFFSLITRLVNILRLGTLLRKKFGLSAECRSD